MIDPYKNFLLHMRLPFNYILSPLFVWGAYVSEQIPGVHFWIGFVAFHVFLYGGTNMFNSYFDRDTGPIGGLEKPPPVTNHFLWGSLLLKAVGLIAAFFVGWGFVICYLIFFIYSIIYSHPAIRIKRYAVASAITVFLCHGIVGYAAGWIAATQSVEGILDTISLIAGAGGAVLVSAFYPFTQIYQMREDRERGDTTLAGRMGVLTSFRYTLLLLLIGGACISYVFLRLEGTVFTVFISGYFFLLIISLWRFQKAIGALTSREIYYRVMWFNYTNSTILLIFLGAGFAS